MQFKPINDYILIKIEEKEEKTASGIFLPDTIQKDKPQVGIVIAVGDGRIVNDSYVKPRVHVGDEVMFAKYAGTELKIRGENYLVLNERDIFGYFDRN